MKAELDLITNKLTLDGDPEEIFNFVTRFNFTTEVKGSQLQPVISNRYRVEGPFNIDNFELLSLSKAGTSHAELAERFGITVKAIASRIRRARQKLQDAQAEMNKAADPDPVPRSKKDELWDSLTARQQAICNYIEVDKSKQWIADKLDCSTQTVYNEIKFLKQLGVIETEAE